MGDHEHRGAPAVDFAEQVHNLKGQGRVDVARGLVGDNHGGVVHQSTGQAHTLALAAGKLGGVMLGLVLQAHQAEDVGYPLADGEHNAHLPADVGDFPFRQAGNIHAVHDNLAGIGPLFAHDQFQEGAFARAGGAHDKDELALLHCKVDVVEGLRAVVIHL